MSKRRLDLHVDTIGVNGARTIVWRAAPKGLIREGLLTNVEKAIALSAIAFSLFGVIVYIRGQ